MPLWAVMSIARPFLVAAAINAAPRAPHAPPANKTDSRPVGESAPRIFNRKCMLRGALQRLRVLEGRGRRSSEAAAGLADGEALEGAQCLGLTGKHADDIARARGRLALGVGGDAGEGELTGRIADEFVIREFHDLPSREIRTPRIQPGRVVYTYRACDGLR